MTGQARKFSPRRRVTYGDEIHCPALRQARRAMLEGGTAESVEMWQWSMMLNFKKIKRDNFQNVPWLCKMEATKVQTGDKPLWV